MKPGALRITVLTDTTIDGVITQQVISPGPESVVVRQIINTKDQQTVASLRKLGWIPPISDPDKYEGLQWYRAQRMEFISRHLDENDFIRQDDVMNFFGVTPVQARMDIRLWSDLHPEVIQYEKVKRRWTKIL